MVTFAVDILAEAIAAHRDTNPDPFTSARDLELYRRLVWWETWKDHADPRDPYAPLPED